MSESLEMKEFVEDLNRPNIIRYVLGYTASA
jgi:hypothetical protein